jgi:RimJ/RimL family protein N-acetyltransferase
MFWIRLRRVLGFLDRFQISDFRFQIVGGEGLPELLTDISQAKRYIDAKKAHPYIWHVIETGRAKELWVDNPSHITSLMVVEEINTESCVCVEADSKETLLDLLSALDPSKCHIITVTEEWMWPVFENELNATFQGRNYEYGLVSSDFTPQFRYTTRELSTGDDYLIETIPNESMRERTRDYFKRVPKSFGVVEADQLIAYACTQDSGDEREIDWVFTREDKRRRGYGTSVVSAVIQYVFRTGGQKVIATVRWKNYGSISVWEKLGFHRGRTFTHYSFRGCDHD